MKKRTLLFPFFLFFALISYTSQAQFEATQWYFGSGAALNFLTSPPSTLTPNSMTNSTFGSASVADAQGNLLFYTNGNNIYTSTHTLMANGTALVNSTNWQNFSQPALIVKKPGSATNYYLFSLNTNANNSPGFYYSEIDMSLAAGQGSVISKGNSLYSGYVGGKLTGTRHCNGTDFWVVIRDWSTNSTTRNFQAFQVSSAGVNTSPVITSASTYTNSNYYDYYGQMKISPNGKKLALGNYNYWYNSQNSVYQAFELWDFDNATGVISNSLALSTYTWNNNYNYNIGWGCEFSPDNTKLYGTRWDYYNGNGGGVLQWDLCAGSPSAVAASESVVATSTINNNTYHWHADMQMATDGKIYIAHYYNNTQASLSVIHNPNNPAASCNYSFSCQNVAPGYSQYGLPNFMASHFAQPPPIAPFTYSVDNMFGCQAASFTSPATPNMTVSNCSSIGYSVTNLTWLFGDPNSGSTNTVSNVTNPIHAFTALGTYTVKLVINYSCGGGVDTLVQILNINKPCISVASSSITCANLGSATVQATGGIGPFSYTWMPTNQTNSVATGLSPGTYTIRVFDFGNNFTYTATTSFVSLIPLTGDLAYSPSIACNGANTGTATVSNFAGGSGTVNFNWFNGVTTYTVPHPQTLSAGVWSMTVSDAKTGCQIKESFYISQPQPQYLTLSASSPTACAGGTIGLSGVASGGTAGYTYSWTPGPALDTRTVSENVAGAYIYSLTSWDANNCVKTNTISVNFIMNPVFTISNSSICPLQTGTINVSGASTYTWSTGSNASFISDNPLITSVYSFTGTALGCRSAATATITLKPIPVPLVSSNTPRCNGQNLNLYAGGGVSYLWSGPLSYTAGQQNPLVTNVNTLQAGVYDVTVTALNSCTASASTTVVVNPTPTLSASGTTVCVNQNLLLYASSFPGSSFVWNGPGYASAAQNPTITPAIPANTGNYFVKVISAVGCTNTAVAHASVTPMPIPSFVTNSPLCFGKTLLLDASKTTGAETFAWTGPNGFSSTLQNDLINNVTLPASGVYNLVVTAGPCTNSTNKQVIVNPLPTPTLTSNSPVCEGKDLHLLTDIGNFNVISYKWTGPVNYLKLAKDPTIVKTTLNQTGLYQLDVKDINGCESMAGIQVAIYPNPTVTASGAIVCRYDAATITAQGAAGYTWFGPYLSVNNAASGIVGSAQYADPQQYLVVGTAANGCTSIATATVTTRMLPVPTISIFPKPRLCVNETATFIAKGGLSYLWGGPLETTYSGDTLVLPIKYSAMGGTYTLTAIDDANCRGYATALLQVDELPQGTLRGQSLNSCVPFCADYTFDSPLASASLVAVTWEVNNQVFKSKQFTYCFKRGGEYVVKGSFSDTSANCKKLETFVVNAYAKPVADFTYLPAKPVESVDEILFTNATVGGGLNKFNWYISDDNYHSENQNINYTFSEPGTYMVAFVVADDNGCADTVVKPIVVIEDFNMYIPNAFTPNGDDMNDEFMPSVRGTKMYDLKVFNRWGALLFQSTDVSRGWDGTFNGDNCKQDVYVYQINVSTVHGENKKYSGQVTLYR